MGVLWIATAPSCKVISRIEPVCVLLGRAVFSARKASTCGKPNQRSPWFMPRQCILGALPLQVFCSLFLMVFHAAVQMQPAPGFKKLLQVLRVKLGIIGGTMYCGTLIAMQSMLRNKNYGPKAHENWQVTFINLLSRAYCKHSKSNVRIYVEDNSIAISPLLPDLHQFWNGRGDSVPSV